MRLPGEQLVALEGPEDCGQGLHDGPAGRMGQRGAT